MFLEFVKSINEFGNNVLFNIFSSGVLMFEGNSTLGVVNMIISYFTSSSSSFIHKIIGVSELEEVVKGLFLEEVSISGKFVE